MNSSRKSELAEANMPQALWICQSTRTMNEIKFQKFIEISRVQIFTFTCDACVLKALMNFERNCERQIDIKKNVLVKSRENILFGLSWCYIAFHHVPSEYIIEICWETEAKKIRLNSLTRFESLQYEQVYSVVTLYGKQHSLAHAHTHTI